MRMTVIGLQDCCLEGETEEQSSLEEGLASKRTVQRHEKPQRYSRKVDHRNDEDMD